MTSNPPAEPRPPSLKRPPDQLRPPHERHPSNPFLSAARAPQIQTQVVDNNVEDRPAKRRKVELTSATNQAAVTTNNANSTSIPTHYLVENQVPHFHLVQMSNVSPEIITQGGNNEQEKASDTEAPELPPRPWNTSQHSNVPDEPKPSHRSRVHIPVPTTPDSMKEPSCVPHFVMQRPAGFFPWTGKHPEDLLSDMTVKQGYFDKPPNPTEKELNTARVPLYNAFKHKSGVDNLSILFSLVLDQRNQHGLISSVSNFKPPPRVTLTEAKRKSWISDLANADVPLRRLSRTIPQGIRGQILLDQCLQHSVPLSRAIWFAKCVCANEIRTLKRKGTTPAVAIGAEYKWLREWTINVEQFIEAQLDQSRVPDWRSYIQYALRLVTRLYLENLLDRDHYLDWIVKSFGSAKVEAVPFWLMVIQIYKDDLTHFRKRGRKLAEAFLVRYDAIKKSAIPAETPLQQKLHQMLRGLLFSRPNSFLMPGKWPEYVAVVESCLDLDSPPERHILSQLNRINKRAMGYNRRELSSQRSPEQAVIEILDSAVAPYDVPVLGQTLASACGNTTLLISTCLGWAMTRFRHATSRIFLFARLVKRWQKAGHDVDSIILNYISACRSGKVSVDGAALKQLTAQLSRSGLFPVGKYIQWLMVRGLPEKGSITSQNLGIGIKPDSIATSNGSVDFDPAQLLLDISLQHVEDHTVNLRSSVLSRAGFDIEGEDRLVQGCRRAILQELRRRGPRLQAKSDGQDHPEPAFSRLPWTVRSAVSIWLRSQVAEAVAASAPSADAHAILTSHMMINCEQFYYIRHVLEALEDEAILADVIGILSCTRDEELLSSLVATLQYHGDAFSALGALEPLQRQICQIYMSWRATRPTMPHLATALLDLCTSFPIKVPSVKLLQQDLVRGDRGRAVAACSPYSDGIAESLQQAGATFIEDFEAILQSEPNMNEQTMNGMFTVLTDRIEKQQHVPEDGSTLFSFCQLLSRLKLCRKVQGDALVKKWFSRLVTALEGAFGTALVRDLVATGCLGFVSLFEALSLSKMDSRKSKPVRNILIEALGLSPNSREDPVIYHVRTKWWEYVGREPRAALEVLCDVGVKNELQASERMLLASLVSHDSTHSPLMSAQASEWAVKALDKLLLGSNGTKRGSDLRALFGSIDSFSHRFVQLRFSLNTPLTSGKATGPDGEELANGLFEALEQQVGGDAGVTGDVSRFSQLLQTVGTDAANQLRHKIEAEFLEALPKTPWNKVASPLTATFPSDVHHLASIVERAFQVCTPATTAMPGFMSQVIDKLSHHIKSVGTQVSPSGAPVIPGLSGCTASMSPAPGLNITSSPMPTPSENVPVAVPSWILEYLRCMLQMICLQRTGLILAGRSLNGKQAQQEQVQLLVRLALIASQPIFTSPTISFSGKDEQQTARGIREFILDVIATIVDEASDEVKLLSGKMLKDKLHRENRLVHLFGSVNGMGSVQTHDAGHGLLISKEGKGVLGDWKPRVWEVIDHGSGKESETSLGLGLFGARLG
ncbi:uncharacterized protein A1O9_03865 [Exophiala aquamarina CBS 119918]|uniref:Mediator of RNA polymerase II transcription subunit 12 n=1 Tax=Exophiala aquamarina CBS 119918 TaxID=1182545 RepID=A0A072PGY2_9EURO|nr:uncharacterized protein A1O9_03865 [Exophiala aquamarina CBS 119918]KEF59022.1 hypothetical protein A1O9_03865 [Exophiala aquamarina CBS 119918]